MDGLKNTVPLGKPYEEFKQMTLFDVFSIESETEPEAVPVSYTHLAGQHGIAVCVHDAGSSGGVGVDEVGAVSYTHLDVYKRQALWSADTVLNSRSARTTRWLSHRSGDSAHVPPMPDGSAPPGTRHCSICGYWWRHPAGRTGYAAFAAFPKCGSGHA